MRKIAVTIVFDTDDGAFELLSERALVDSIRNGLLRAYPLWRSSEIDVHAEPCEKCGWKRQWTKYR